MGIRFKRLTAAGCALVAAANMLTPVRAATAFVVTGTATLPSFPCSGGGHLLAPATGCSGTFAGTTLIRTSGSVNIDGARITAYYEPCLPEVWGSARGVLTDSTRPGLNKDFADFTWLRVGLTAYVAIHPTTHGDSFDLSPDTSTGGGNALATFGPIGTGNCVTGSAGLQATVVAVGVI